jgi:hypothetical protein
MSDSNPIAALERTSLIVYKADTATGVNRGYVSFSANLNASSGASLGAGIFVVSGNISLASSTLFANTAKGGSAGTCLAMRTAREGAARVAVFTSAAAASL